LGGVGSGTTIDHVEVIANLDDAFELFGGTVNLKYIVGMHCDDDYIDYDQGWNGKIQFFYGLQGPDNSGGAFNQGDNGFEADGDDNATNIANGGLSSNPRSTTPRSSPVTSTTRASKRRSVPSVPSPTACSLVTLVV
jgi:hypothetical protein